jgi:C4-dicarboxylate transporter DctM subunit
MFGKLRNGLALVTLVAIMVFSAICGSSVATAVAIGRVMIPKLIENGYHPRFAVGLVAAAGGLGILIPPSVPLIVYAAVVEISVGEAFLAALGPGILLGLLLCVFVYFLGDRARVSPAAEQALDSFPGGRLRVLLAGLPMFLLPVLILGGIYGGVFTPTEAAAVAVILAAAMALTIYRKAPLSDLVRTTAEAGTLSASILIIMGATSILSYLIAYQQIPNAFTRWVVGLELGPLAFLLLVNLLLLILGCFLEIISIILIVVPIILPTLKHLNIDLVHFAIVVIINMELAVITPPVGMNLFVVSAISGRPIAEVFRGTLPFALVIGAALLVFTCVPSLATFMLRIF